MSKTQQEQKARILKGLAHPVRLSIVELLSEKELCVKEIADLYPFDRTTISKHLAQLRKLNILEGVRDGLNIYYHLKMSALPMLLDCLNCSPEEMQAKLKGDDANSMQGMPWVNVAQQKNSSDLYRKPR